MAIYYAGSMGNRGAVSQLPSCPRLFSGFYCVLFIELTLESSEKRDVLGTCSILKNSATCEPTNLDLCLAWGCKKRAKVTLRNFMPSYLVYRCSHQEELPTASRAVLASEDSWAVYTSQSVLGCLHHCLLRCEEWSCTGVLQARLFLLEEISSGRELILMDSLCSFIRARQSRVCVCIYHLFFKYTF